MQKPHSAYYSHYERVKPMKKWPLFALIALCAVLLVSCFLAFYFANDNKYAQALQLAHAWEFNEADKLTGILLPQHPQLKELHSYIQAGFLMENGNYENAQKEFTALGDFLDSQTLTKECQFRQAQKLFSLGNYAEAREILVQLGNYSEAQLWADESAYRMGTGYYTQLADAVDPLDIITLAQNAINQFNSAANHENASIMLERTSAYIYSLAVEAFDMASTYYNKIEDPASAPAQAPAANEEETQEPPATQDMGEENYLTMFQDASEYFNIIPDYMESRRYIDLIALTGQPEEAAAVTLRNDMWEFAPARKFIFGRYIPQFFYGTWSGGGYYIQLTDIYRFYMLSIEDGTNGSFGSGGISNNTKTGWKTAYSFRVLSKDTIEVIGRQVYTLSRMGSGEETENNPVQPESAPTT